MFSKRFPGAPARVQERGALCMWYFEDALEAASRDEFGKRNINHSLAMVLKRNHALYEKALRRLGPFWQVSTRYCQGDDCVYSLQKPGGRTRPAR